MSEHGVDRLAAYVNQMGKVSDDEIAHMAGLSRNSVGAYRRKRGIPAYTGYLFESADGKRSNAGKRKPRASGRRRGRASKLEPYVDLLGVRTDAEVASIAGVARASVTMYRNRNGIPASRQLQALPPSSVAPVKVSIRSKSSLSAFSILARAGEQQAEFVAFGTDILDAARRAEAALGARTDGPWRIDGLQFLGGALIAAA